MKKKVLYFECKTGAAGDMLMSALYSLLGEEQKKEFLKKINSISNKVCVTPENKKSKGIAGIHMCVSIQGKDEEEYIKNAYVHVHEETEHSHEHTNGHSKSNRYKHSSGHDYIHHNNHEHGHEHSCYQTVLQKIMEFDFSEHVTKHAKEIYQLIAAAESKVHGGSIEHIHFHEVGSLDALVDVVGCCLAIDMLQVDEIQGSSICIGSGTVRCAHGILPVPAPATAEIIKGIPVYNSSFEGELLTPTGAAILKHFVEDFSEKMNMEIVDIGYGIGTKEFTEASFVRAFLGYK